ncbi:MAG: MBL fold metallo-hydrolase [Planctomycetota bacterium]|jgi:L-ascorbate metabolism protein UlaG (beta-lactamase superfamily)
MNRKPAGAARWCVPAPLLLLLLCLLTPRAVGQVTVTYVANAGFLLEGGGKRVLIDALFDAGIKGYPRIPDTIRPDLEGARGAYADVDLVLVTHEHADHFGPHAVRRHLAANPAARLLSTRQVVDRLGSADAEPSARIEAVDLAPGTSVQLRRNEIDLRVLDLHHGRGRTVRNLGFLVEIGGMSVLHVGDTEVTLDEIRPHGLRDETIDVALLPSWLLCYERWIEVVREAIRPRAIVIMHMAERDAPPSFFGTHGSFDARMRVIRREFPDALLMETPGASQTFGPSAGATNSAP